MPSRRALLVSALGAPFTPAIATIQATAQDNPRFASAPFFQENFNTFPLNTSYWTVRDSGSFMATGKTGPGSTNWPSMNDKSTAVDQASNVEVSRGTAKLWVRKAATPRLSPYKTGWSTNKVFDHTAGYLDTIGKVEVKYGRWEIRCKMPVGPNRAVWGGMWLISNKSSQLYFEVDINEGFGFNEKNRLVTSRPVVSHNRAQASVHFDDAGSQKISRFSPQFDDNFENEWHVWAVEIMPDTGITFFLDGSNYFNVPASHPEVAVRFAQDFKFNIRINLMTGSYWNTTDTDTKRERPLEIDYVRVYKRYGDYTTHFYRPGAGFCKKNCKNLHLGF